jgi:hypothetical protein
METGQREHSPAQQLSGSCVAAVSGHSIWRFACPVQFFVVSSEKKKFVDKVNAAVGGGDVQGRVFLQPGGNVNIRSHVVHAKLIKKKELPT